MIDVHMSLELCIRKPVQTVTSDNVQDKGVLEAKQGNDI
jgi:hypothetical protein